MPLFLQVDATKGTITESVGIYGPQTVYTFKSAPPAVGKAVLKVANIMQHEIDLRGGR